MKIQDLNLLKSLGKGTMGEVYLSQKDGDKRYYATKKMDRVKADRPQVRKYFRTLFCQKHLTSALSRINK